MYKLRRCETDVTNLLHMKRLMGRKYNIHVINGTVDSICVWCGETIIVVDGVKYKFMSEEILKRFRRYIDVGDNVEITYLVDQYDVTRIARIVNHSKSMEFCSTINTCIFEFVKRNNSSTI